MNTPKNIKHFLSVVLLFAVQGVVWGQTVTVTYNNPGGPYSAPIPGCATNVTGQAWGGGGGGGGCTFLGYGRGGGSGAFVIKNFGSGGFTASIVVGNGGARGESGNNNGSSGTASTMTDNNAISVSAGPGTGGSSGSGSTPGSGGTASGGDPGSSNGNGGSGGNGGSAPGPGGGAGGSQPTSAGTGNAGSQPGGGGSGGNCGVNEPGGRGGDGRVILSFDFLRPVISGTNIYCEGNELTLNASNLNPCVPTSAYIWKRNGTPVGNGETLTISNVSGDDAGSYTIEYDIPGSYTYSNSTSVTSDGGVSYSGGIFTITSAAVSVTIIPLPTLTLSSGIQNPTVCQGTAITNIVFTFDNATGVSVTPSPLPGGLSSNTSGKTVTISGTPTAGGTYTITTIGQSAPCTAVSISGTVTVNPIPVIANKTATICSGEQFTVTPIDGTDIVPAGTTYTWSAPTPTGVTGATAGSGANNISGTLTNTTNLAQTVTYTVTPSAGSCTGTSFTVTVTVNPKPVIANTTATICSGGTFTVSPTNGTDIVPSGTTYSWSIPSPLPDGVTGAAAGTNAGNISGTLTNINSTSRVVTYVVTPKTGDCTGTPFNVSVTVKPRPNIANKTVTICSGETFTVSPTNSTDTVPPGTTYTWSAPSAPTTVTGRAAGSNESSISGTLTNTTNVAQTVTYMVTPDADGCNGTSFTVTVTVNPKPVIANTTATICSGGTFTVSPTNGTDIVPSGTTYSWSIPSLPAGVTGAVAGTDAGIISGTLTNTNSTSQFVTYVVTPKAGSCTGTAFNVSVAINVKPQIDNISLTDITDTIYCANEALNFPSVPFFSSNPSELDQGWQLDGDVITYPAYTLIAADNAKKLRYFVTNDCGTGYSNEITIRVVVTEITSITPASGPTTGGIYTSNPLIPIDPSGEVTITGNGFAPLGSPAVTQVSFGGVAATNITVIDNNTLTCIPPPQITSGYVAVSITAACGTTVLTDGYLYEAMNITEVIPNYAPVTGGDTIIIKGTGLLAAPGLENSVSVTLCGVPAEVVFAHNDSIVCITGPSGFSKRDSIEIYNGMESRGFANSFTYYPVTFIVNGVWSEAYNWETQTDDRILPYPGAVIHIKANCLQDIDLLDGYPYPNGKMDSITVYPNKSYTIGNGITLDANVFTLKDNASFLNNGNMQATQQKAEHLLVQGRNWYVASPVQTALIDDALGKGALGGNLTSDGQVDLSSIAAPSDWRVEWYEESGHNWQRLPLGSNLITGRGYTVFSENEDIAVQFSGTYHDGNQGSPALTRQSDAHIKRGFNLVGNPFPSYWRWTEAAASGANLYSTIWYRTHVAGVYEFWSYNASGDVAVAPGWSDATPTGSYSLAYIPPMQAFWVRLRDGESAGAITFTNSRRSHADHASNLLKSSDGSDERPLLRLTISSSKNTDETLIYADSRAQNGFDDFDSDKWFTGAGVELFTLPVAENRELVINGLSGISDGMEIPLGFQADEGGSFTFFAKEIRNLDRFDVFLRDKWRNGEVNLRSDGIYNFTSGSAYDTERFSVVFRNLAATQTDVIYPAGDGYLFAYSDNDGKLVALYSGQDDCEVRIYDIAGRLIAVQTIMSNTPTLIKGKFMKGVYVLRAGNYSAKALVK